MRHAFECLSSVYVSTLAKAGEAQFVATSQADEVYVGSMAGAYQTYQASLALADRDFTVNVAASVTDVTNVVSSQTVHIFLGTSRLTCSANTIQLYTFTQAAHRGGTRNASSVMLVCEVCSATLAQTVFPE